MLINEKLLKENDDVKKLRSVLEEKEILQPPEWFYHTMNEGVLWLNTALTFSSVEKTSLGK
jgi:hypothetical protein